MLNGVCKIDKGFSVVRGSIKGSCKGTCWGVPNSITRPNRTWNFEIFGSSSKVVWVAPLETFIWNEEDA